eukprot:CAMPEP_0119332616 /NCGR_PEP_ID=MMETSP1333-20130426/83183_1 /TAXON_ID=418940 /ORGANISM="Scyphosphaera apsteinii, Strain RCC1455" /LENGTH=117 /DNA_ID=CAMNT_0007342479 /DNA_START=108 /DNA_END=458 /DNA_ORIENTATION=+
MPLKAPSFDTLPTHGSTDDSDDEADNTQNSIAGKSREPSELCPLRAWLMADAIMVMSTCITEAILGRILAGALYIVAFAWETPKLFMTIVSAAAVTIGMVLGMYAVMPSVSSNSEHA